jgi:pimeloyl-ACP methyl ester carboxylesterase
MNRRFLKTFAKAILIIGILGVLVLAIGPFLIPVSALEGLSSAQQVATQESKFITIPFDGTDGIDIHFLSNGENETGNTPTFVLLHGSNFNAYTWREVLDFFSQKGRVIAYDQIPYGLSEKLVAGDWNGQNPYASEAAVAQLFSLLDALNIGKAILVGNSYGATLAVQAVQADPNRVEALILADAAVYVNEQMPAWLMESPQMRRLGPLFARQLGQNEAFIRQTYLNPDQINAERMALTLIQTKVENWDAAYWEYLRVWGVDTPDYISGIPDIQQPVLVLSGDSDTIVPVSDSQKLHSALPNAELEILPACGHVPQEECPELFIEAVDSWLNQSAQK